MACQVGFGIVTQWLAGPTEDKQKKDHSRKDVLDVLEGASRQSKTARASCLRRREL
jgi:hypothetical protein